ncbi:MAG: tRNA (adenosine(37)-N6)-dimethylallyltransferase MiaA [Hyphomonadaceae bacterium]|nr:tRNA (adenosine(37)-N6)-dimethylallyltransferase MiaA [Hyphomonadaceae bacterium]
MNASLLIHGPTASGKTQLAIELAEALNGEIVNADSMQIYKDLNVLTARPSEDELAAAPHHLFGSIDAAIRYSTGQWLEDARGVIADILRRGRTPILVGGTGLYFLALTQGLSDIPPVPEEVRGDVRTILSAEGANGLRARLEAVDPQSADRIKGNDRQRLSRAYEVWLATGKTLTAFQGARTPPPLGPNEWLGVALTPPRPRLYARIDRRFDGMMMKGAMEEARALVERGLPEDLPVMKAHGMPWLAAFLREQISAEDAAENAKRDTRRYAKRQFTWIGRQFPFWPRIPSMDVQDRKKVIFALYREIDPG